MIRAPLFLLAVAILIAAALAWWPWRRELGRKPAWAGLIARFVAILATLLLLFDPGVRLGSSERPLVLLDNSVSMHATAANPDSALALATSLGDVVEFGELMPGEPGGSSRLSSSLASAVAAARPIIVVTDGEIQDAAGIPADLLAQATVHLLPRTVGANIAITDVRMPTRLSVGDTLHFEIDILGAGDAADTIRLEVLDGDSRLASVQAVLDSGRRSGTVQGEFVLPTGLTGDRFIAVRRVGSPDAEPQDDLRWRSIRVTSSPGIVLVADTPDWDARTLLATLASVTAAPVRGFVQLVPGTWHRMDNLAPVSLATVRTAAADADLLAVLGDTTSWRTLGRTRLMWPVATAAGDWYLGGGGASPLSAALVGVDTDALPPLAAVSQGIAGEWIGLVAQRSRRGADVPVVAGSAAGTRTIVIGAAGFHGWAMQGGVAEQVWRTMIAQGVEWLLSAPPTDANAIRLLDPVVQRGRAVRFSGTSATEAAIEFSRDTLIRIDTLRFDGDGIATAALPPGRWQWQTDSSHQGELMVERYSDELLPAPVRLGAAEAAVVPRPARRSLRELWPLFAVAVAGFVTEWLIRRKLALR